MIYIFKRSPFTPCKQLPCGRQGKPGSTWKRPGRPGGGHGDGEPEPGWEPTSLLGLGVQGDACVSAEGSWGAGQG